MQKKNIDTLECDIAEYENRTQDILHMLEFEDLSYHERARLATELVEVRKNRRKSKDAYEVIQPLCQWVVTYKPQIHELERVLGKIREIENKHKNRIYVMRTEDRQIIAPQKE